MVEIAVDLTSIQHIAKNAYALKEEGEEIQLLLGFIEDLNLILMCSLLCNF
jgi:hypothetical protein